MIRRSQPSLLRKTPRAKTPRPSRTSLWPRVMAIRMRKHCTTWQPCKFFPKRGDPPCPYSNRQPPPRRSKTTATADLSACNDTSAILGQHKACPDRDDSERTRSVTTPSVPLSHDAENAFLNRKEDFPIHHGQAAQRPQYGCIIPMLLLTRALVTIFPRFSASTKPVPRSR